MHRCVVMMRSATVSSDNALRWIHDFLTAPSATRPALIDIRPTLQFTADHISHSTHFDGLHGQDGLINRLSELPPPQHRRNAAILATSAQHADEAVSFLRLKGFQDILPLTMHDFMSDIALESGYKSVRLWHPAPVVLRFVPLIVKHLQNESRTALDVGAGAGRDVAYLVEHGFKVVAVDRDPQLVQKCVTLVNRYNPSATNNVRGIVRTFGANLTEDIAFLKQNSSSLLVVVRFLRQGVLQKLWHAVAPGGFVLYEHFLQGCERYGGPMKQSQMLRRGQLRTIFSEQRGFSIRCDEETNLADGRPIVRFLAQRLH